MALADDLMPFLSEHRRCGRLDGGVEGGWLRLWCECGAEMVRPVDEE